MWVAPEGCVYFAISQVRLGMPDSTTPVSDRGKRHEGLKAWVACHELTLAVYRITSPWPKDEQYALTSQVRRAAYGAAANIAEGSAKRGSREFRRFLDMSLGSLSELSYLLLLSRDLGYLTSDKWGELEAIRDHAGRLTWGLYRALNGKPPRGPAAPLPPKTSAPG
jgi:four helix bundle protein